MHDADQPKESDVSALDFLTSTGTVVCHLETLGQPGSRKERVNRDFLRDPPINRQLAERWMFFLKGAGHVKRERGAIYPR